MGALTAGGKGARSIFGGGVGESGGKLPAFFLHLAAGPTLEQIEQGRVADGAAEAAAGA
jgi:hypothetical protein